MQSEKLRETRRKNYEYLLNILDEAEGERNTDEGAFSFLSENSYVREVVVTPGMKTSIAGLKTFLPTEVLDIFGSNNRSKVSYKNILAQLSGDMSKKYSFEFKYMDDFFDVEKNRNAMLQKCCVLPENEDVHNDIATADILIPYLFMDKLRSVVWDKLRTFFKLCEQSGCNECIKKSEVYFQFIQAVALYEIFCIAGIQEKAVFYMQDAMEYIEEIKSFGKQLEDCVSSSKEEMLSTINDILAGIQVMKDEKIEILAKKVGHAGIYQLLIGEFFTSLYAMYYLLMMFEAMNVCSGNMRGIKKISLRIQEEIEDIYEKNVAMLQRYNKKRAKRYKEVNKKLEELLERYAYKEYDESIVIVTFMEQLCKTPKKQNKEVLRGLEYMLGYPIYKEFGGE